MISRLLTALGLVLLAAVAVVRTIRPPAPLPASAAATAFSAERAASHIAKVAQRPHSMGTPEHDRVRDYILGQLAALGVRSEVQATTAIGTRYQAAGAVQNVLGYLPGTVSGGKAVLIAVHYDGVGAGPAAADDGAGVGALLETLRALRASGKPLRHDVIALFTDGEETGLLGAAAFAREHPRAKDVAVMLNFEARGTTGRSYMFESGAGNLDAVRMLRRAGDVTAGSVFTAVYRALPNDTDLSELSILGTPALNFAFTGGVQRYHTSRDDLAHLNHGSLQHHGNQMLALATAFANSDLPRPATGDAVFFDLPLIGLVVYPIWLAYPIALAALVLLVLQWRADRRGIAPALGVLVAALVISIAAALQVRLTGPAMWSGWYGAALALGTVAVNAAAYELADRWGGARTASVTVWALLAVATTLTLPAVSYLVAWPALFALIAARSRHPVAEWVSVAFALTLLAGLAAASAVVLLGVTGIGALALVLVTTLVTWLCGPLLRGISMTWWKWPVVAGGAAVALAIVARRTAVIDADHPARTGLVYVQNADAGEAFLGATTRREPWTRSVLQTLDRAPAWASAASPSQQPLYGHAASPTPDLGAPQLVTIADSIVGSARAVTFQVTVPAGTTATAFRVTGTPVLSAEIDGRRMRTDRFRRSLPFWGLEYWNVGPGGARIMLTVARNGSGELEIAARRPGLPGSVTIAQRPPGAVPSQEGDVSVAYRKVRF